MRPQRPTPVRRRSGPLRSAPVGGSTTDPAHSVPPRPVPGRAIGGPVGWIGPDRPVDDTPAVEPAPVDSPAVDSPAVEEVVHAEVPPAEPVRPTEHDQPTTPPGRVRVQAEPTSRSLRTWAARRPTSWRTMPVTARGRRILAAQLVVGTALLGGLGGLVVDTVRGSEYQADTDVLVTFWDVDGFLLTGNANPVTSLDVAAAATLATSREVLTAAADQLDDGTTASDLDDQVSVVPQTTSNAVTISAVASTSDEAAAIAAAVADAVVASVQERIQADADSLSTATGGDVVSAVTQRADVLTRTVRPLQVLSPGEPEQTAPTAQLPVALAVVGLAAGALLALGLLFSRPVVSRTRDAQRLLTVPAVTTGTPAGDAEAARVLDRIGGTGSGGDLLVVPLDADAEADAEQFTAWANARGDGSRRWRTAPPAPLAALGRPDARVDAVLLLLQLGSAQRDVTEAADLLAGWHPVDAVVVPAADR